MILRYNKRGRNSGNLCYNPNMPKAQNYKEASTSSEKVYLCLDCAEPLATKHNCSYTKPRNYEDKGKKS